MSLEPAFIRSLQGPREVNLPGDRPQSVSANANRPGNNSAPPFSQEIRRASSQLAGQQSTSAFLPHTTSQPLTLSTGYNVDTLDPSTLIAPQSVPSIPLLGSQREMNAITSPSSVSNNAVAFHGQQQPALLGPLQWSGGEQYNPSGPGNPNPPVPNIIQRRTSRQGQHTLSPLIMMVHLVDHGDRPLLARRDSSLLNSGIYRDAIARSGLELALHPYPENHSTITASGYETQGHLVQLTTRSRSGHGCLCQLTVMNRQNPGGREDAMEIDIVLGMDYLGLLPPLPDGSMSIQQRRDSMPVRSSSRRIAGRSQSITMSSSGIPEFNQSYQNNPGYMTGMTGGWQLVGNQPQGLHPSYPSHMPSLTTTIPSSQSSAVFVPSAATSPDGNVGPGSFYR